LHAVRRFAPSQVRHAHAAFADMAIQLVANARLHVRLDDSAAQRGRRQ
jgi:hypothetical protein